MERKYIKYSIVMVSLFLVGGFSFVFYIFQAYDVFWRSETFQPLRQEFQNSSSELNRSLVGRVPPNSENTLTSPFSLMLLVDGILSVSGGISLWQLTKEKEMVTMKESISSLLLTPEEKIIIEELKRSGGQLNQNQLVRKTGLSKVKVHRALNRLTIRKIVKKYPYGMTNKIVLEKTVIES